ncbi:ArnT family glycosyltransferase [Nocardia sp. alder85J]|uniref:ArnT family glycosyltransferase n=1 Tax=Nocardia sp. alder85J TaxID=2862949 RepID=UPI001CD74C6C|nr:glycosyltransferase family 39 protein [Nocardia sp. alder85J]MCX4097344.1 glycosyltransferase family 39 protein [Nocardia sp. alder85J]
MVLVVAAVATPNTESETARARFGGTGVTVLAVLTAAALTIPGLRYDYFGDELYFVAAGSRPGIAYADQGALVPLLARFTDLLAPGSAVALRIPAIVMAALAVVVSAAIAYEFGGHRRTQLLAGVAYATSPLALTQAAQLSTFSLDATLQATLVWLLIRWIRTRDDRLLILVGLVAAGDIQVKWLIPVTLCCLLAGLMVAGPRRLWTRRAFWLGALVFGAGAAPDLYWQATHGWPELAMSHVVGAEQDAAGGGPLACIPQIIGLAGLLGGLLGGWGLWQLLRWPPLRPYRFLFVTAVSMIAVVLIGHGRPYYVGGLMPAVFAAGAVGLSAFYDTRWRDRVRRGAVVAAAGSLAIIAVLLAALPLPRSGVREPITSPSGFAVRSDLYGPSGWQDLTAGVAAAYRQLPPGDHDHTVLIAQNYWQAGALEKFGPRYRLPATYSPNRGYGFFGPPPATARTVLYIGLDSAAPALRRQFESVEPAGRIDDPLGYPGVNRGVAVFVCRWPTAPWPVLWPSMTQLQLPLGI